MKTLLHFYTILFYDMNTHYKNITKNAGNEQRKIASLKVNECKNGIL